MLFHKVKFPRTMWMPNPCSHSPPNLTFQICNRKDQIRLFAELVVSQSSHSSNLYVLELSKWSAVEKFASCSPVWRWSSAAATAWLDIYSWSTVLRLQLLLTLYSSCLRSTALLTRLQLLLTHSNLGIAQPPLQIQAWSGALPDIRGGCKHVPRVRL